MTYYTFLDDFLTPSILYRVSEEGSAELWTGEWEDIGITSMGEVFEIDEEAARKAFPPEAFT